MPEFLFDLDVIKNEYGRSLGPELVRKFTRSYRDDNGNVQHEIDFYDEKENWVFRTFLAHKYNFDDVMFLNDLKLYIMQSIIRWEIPLYCRNPTGVEYVASIITRKPIHPGGVFFIIRWTKESPELGWHTRIRGCLREFPDGNAIASFKAHDMGHLVGIEITNDITDDEERWVSNPKVCDPTNILYDALFTAHHITEILRSEGVDDSNLREYLDARVLFGETHIEWR